MKLMLTPDTLDLVLYFDISFFRRRLFFPSSEDKEITIERITIDPAICHGKPTVRGMRYPVETILEMLSSGMSPDDILADYEDLEYADILAVLAYAARLVQVKRVELFAA